MLKVYRYILSFDDADPAITYPVVGDGQQYEITLEPGHVFYRKKLTGDQLVFCNSNYEAIYSRPATTKFTINISLLNPFGIYETDFVGVFYRRDCDFDDDAKQVSVQPEPLDQYKLILEGMDKEYNIPELGIPTVEVDYWVQPIFQLYSVVGGQGSSKIINIYGGLNYESEVPNPVGPILDPLIDDYKFGALGNLLVLGGPVFDPVVPTEYINEPGVFFPEQKFISKDGTHRIEYNTGTGYFNLKEISSGSTLYEYPPPGSLVNGQFTSLTSGAILSSNIAFFYGRLLTANTSVNGDPTEALPEEDILPRSNVYAYSLPLGVTGFGESIVGTIWEDVMVASFNNSEDPDKYGKVADDSLYFVGNYFNTPTTGEVYYPILNSLWTNSSFWFKYTDDVKFIEEGGAKSVTVKNAYRLFDVLSAMITQLDPTISVPQEASNSDFFFGDSNPIRQAGLTPIIIPKSNVILGDYNYPATRAPLKLQEVSDLLYGFHKCKWYIDALELYVEHEEYFNRGGSYTTNVIGVDLTTLVEPKTSLPWSYKTAKWKYAKQKLPGQIRFAWMEPTAQPFDGHPIDMLDEQADKANIQDINLSRFSADLNFMQLFPEKVSLDGFAFVEAELVSERYTVPIVSMEYGATPNYKVQNGYASLIYAHETYWKYLLPTSAVNVNLAVDTALSVIRPRVQEIEIPSDLLQGVNLMQLIRNTLGDGKIQKVVDNTDGTGTKVTIEHNDY